MTTYCEWLKTELHSKPDLFAQHFSLNRYAIQPELAGNT